MGTVPALTPRGTPRGRESIAAMALQHPQTPFRRLCHMHGLQPKRSTESHLTSTHREAKSRLPKSQNFILPRKVYKNIYPTSHASREKPKTARWAKAQEKLSNLSETAPGLKTQEVPRLLLSLLLWPQEHTALLPSQGITVCLASHTQRGFVRQNVCQRDREPIVG